MDEREEHYHKRQCQTIYRSTVKFCDWLEAIGLICPPRFQRILDSCCGMGANTVYMAKRYPDTLFIGVDNDGCCIEQAYTHLQDSGIHPKSPLFWEADTMNLPRSLRDRFDGVICLQTLTWLPSYEDALRAFCELRPKWIAVSSLFYDGPVSVTSQVSERIAPACSPRRQYYNVYSIPEIRQFFRHHGYSTLHYTPFEIDMDLPKPISKLMGTYTEKLETGERIQRSGPLLMPWYFVATVRDDD